MIILAAVLFLLAVLVLWLAGRGQKAGGLPHGRVVYTDTSAWGRVEKPLYDSALHLTGRPDYLLRRKGVEIPVEVKSGWAPESPYPGHIYQLAAYCLLAARTFSQRPPYGLIHYRNRTFAIDYTAEMEAHLIDLITEMRQDESRRELDRSHDDAARCAACGYRGICDQRL